MSKKHGRTRWGCVVDVDERALDLANELSDYIAPICRDGGFPAGSQIAQVLSDWVHDWAIDLAAETAVEAEDLRERVGVLEDEIAQLESALAESEADCIELREAEDK